MANKIELKVDFTDFWPGFDKKDNFFYNLLVENFTVTISDTPDLLFYSVYTFEHLKYTNCTKILYTGENQRPDFMLCDFAFSFDYSSRNRNYRLPLYALWGDLTALINRQVNAREVLSRKEKFCCFVVSNGGCEIRNDFFNNLSKYKQVDSGGKYLNNIGAPITNKSEFIRKYKFVISFENESYPGYTTEKVYEPLLEHCVPIYWGNPLVEKDFNTNSFINCHDYPSFKEVINKIIEIDNDDEKYMQYINEPAFKDDKLNDLLKKENIVAQLDQIVTFHFNGRFKARQRLQPAYLLMKAVIQKINAAKTITKKIIRWK